MVRLLAIALIALPAPTLANEIPKSFRGDYIAQFDDGRFPSTSLCKQGDFGKLETDAMLRVSAKEALYHESGCRLTKRTASENALTLEFACGGEGEEWKSREVWVKAQIYGKSFLVISSSKNKDASIYLRCDG